MIPFAVQYYQTDASVTAGKPIQLPPSILNTSNGAKMKTLSLLLALTSLSAGATDVTLNIERNIYDTTCG